MVDRWGPYAANLLTALRVLLTPFFILTVWLAEGALLSGVVAVLLFAVIAASDVLDGRLARRWRTASNAGRAFDHFADVGFLVLALTAYVGLGIAPWWVPATVAGTFAFYVIDSWRRPAAAPDGVAGQAPRSDQAEPALDRMPAADPPAADPPGAGLIGSRIGHVGGVCNYVLVGVLVCNNSARIQLLSPAFLSLLFCLVPLYSGGAVVARLRSRRAAAPVVGLAGTGD
jgi:hypothetical protein